MGMAAILVMWPGPFIQTFVPPSQGGSTYNLALIGQAVSEEKMFKHCWQRQRPRPRPRQRQRQRQRMPEQGYTISSPCEPNGSGELKKHINGPWKPEARNWTCLSFYACPGYQQLRWWFDQNERASMETPFSHYKSMGNVLDLKGS